MTEDMPKGPTPKVLTVAHRGASAYAPENTLASIRLAIEMCADAVEIDVHLTRDRVPVLMHDAALERTTNGHGAVAQHDVSRIRSLRVTGPQADKFADERVPTLAEALLQMEGEALPVIEVKEEHAARPVVDVLRRARMLDEAAIISFEEKLLADVAELEPRVPTALLVGGEAKGEPKALALDLLHRARACRANCLDLGQSLARPQVVTTLRRRGMSVWVWTVDEPSAMRELVNMGAGAITTNCPDVLRRVLAEMEA